MERSTESAESLDRVSSGLVSRLLGTGKRATVGARLIWIGVLMLVVVGLVGWLVSRGSTRASVATTRPADTGPSARSSSASGSRAGGRSPAAVAPSSVSWHILASRTTRQIQNEYLPPSTASGIFLIMDVAATNATRDVVTLHDDQVALDIDGSEYPLDSAALSALELAGHKALSGTLGPEATAAGWVVFDVPRAAIAARPRLCLDVRALDLPTRSQGCLS